MEKTLTSIILRIDLEYANAILDGTKTVEFRRNKFMHPVDRILLYCASPIQQIIGSFQVGKIVEDTPENLWTRFNKVGGIDQASFFEYFKNSGTGFAIEVESFEKFAEGINLADYFENFCAPKKYLYLEERTTAVI